jgi:hypothetical protein
LWWYTGGIVYFGQFSWNLLQAGNFRLAPGLWLKNIFVPMFGQVDFQGRMVSFFMRLVNVIGRSIALFFWLLMVLFIFCLWLVFPIFVVYMIGKAII